MKLPSSFRETGAGSPSPCSAPPPRPCARPTIASAAGGRASPTGCARAHPCRPRGISWYVPCAPAASARSKPARECCGLTPGMPRQVAIPGAVHHVEPLAAQRVDRQPLRDPRGEPEQRRDRLVLRGGDRHRAAHREADEQRGRRALCDGEVERGARIRDAGRELVPRLEPVANLDQRHLARRAARARRRAARSSRSRCRAPRARCRR